MSVKFHHWTQQVFTWQLYERTALFSKSLIKKDTQYEFKFSYELECVHRNALFDSGNVVVKNKSYRNVNKMK